MNIHLFIWGGKCYRPNSNEKKGSNQETVVDVNVKKWKEEKVEVEIRTWLQIMPHFRVKKHR